jgi:hypothetical protein
LAGSRGIDPRRKASWHAPSITIIKTSLHHYNLSSSSSQSYKISLRLLPPVICLNRRNWSILLVIQRLIIHPSPLPLAPQPDPDDREEAEGGDDAQANKEDGPAIELHPGGTKGDEDGIDDDDATSWGDTVEEEGRVRGGWGRRGKEGGGRPVSCKAGGETKKGISQTISGSL